MKKIIAILLVLALCSFCMISCRKDNNNNGGGDGEKEDQGQTSGPEEEDGGDGILNKDNIDPNGWTKVDK